jgi:hypothetical protein
VTFVQGNHHLLGGFSHCLDTFGAEYLMYFAALFHHQSLLQVRFELAIGGSLGEGTRVSKGCGFPTMCTFSHIRETSFLAIIPKFNCFFTRAGHFIIENRPAQEPVASMTAAGTTYHRECLKSGKINKSHFPDLAPIFPIILDLQKLKLKR